MAHHLGVSIFRICTIAPTISVSSIECILAQCSGTSNHCFCKLNCCQKCSAMLKYSTYQNLQIHTKCQIERSWPLSHSHDSLRMSAQHALSVDYKLHQNSVIQCVHQSTNTPTKTQHECDGLNVHEADYCSMMQTTT